MSNKTKVQVPPMGNSENKVKGKNNLPVFENPPLPPAPFPLNYVIVPEDVWINFISDNISRLEIIPIAGDVAVEIYYNTEVADKFLFAHVSHYNRLYALGSSIYVGDLVHYLLKNEAS